jgi:chromosome segregation ATPase
LATTAASFRTIRHLASEICGVRPANDNDENENLREEETAQIWASLFQLTSSLARPVSSEKIVAATLPPSELKYYILSNLLDIAVNHPNLDDRRSYIGRILQLSKSSQKRLMALIERRVKRKRTTPLKSTPRKDSIPSEADSAHVPSSDSKPAANPYHGEAAGRDIAGTPSSTMSTPVRIPKTQSRAENLVQSTPPPSRTHNDAFAGGTPTGYTPATKRQSVRSPDGFLSPGTMDSPQAIRSILLNLQQKNKALSHDLALAQRRELEFKTKQDALKQNHRKDMIRLESASMEREQDLKKELEAKHGDLQKQVETLYEDATNGRKAQDELNQARDELDILARHRSDLVEMAEKVRKYKEKVGELHDIKEALKREQEAHSRSVDAIVKLENEVKVLHPAKRQLEDYKIRAIEAEVRLVECQDYLRRLEQQAHDATENSDSLSKETIMQKGQMEELVQRIREETQAGIDSTGKSVADGVSELNPDLQQELVRLRNENLQLRAFAAKRQNDQVETLEANLDDAKRLAERYKEHYLQTKESLKGTEATLLLTEEREEQLLASVLDLKARVDEVRKQLSETISEKEELAKSLETVKKSRDSLDKENDVLREEIQSLQMKLKETYDMGVERLNQLRKVTEDLGQASQKLEREQIRSKELEESAEAWKTNATDMQSQCDKKMKELAEKHAQLKDAYKQLDDAQEAIHSLTDQMKALELMKFSLEEQVEEERQSSNKALLATKEVLMTKHQQEISEQSQTMSHLLEEERKNSRLVLEKAQQELQEMKEAAKESEERLEQKHKLAQEELSERINEIREECRAEVEKARQEGTDKVDEIVRKGKNLINEAKSKAKDEIQAMDNEMRDLEDQINEKIREKNDMQKVWETKEAALESKLDSSVAQINAITLEVDDLQESKDALQRDHRRLREENDLYRRQVGGRFGSDGKLQGQFESLQKEYNTLLEENRQLKRQNRNNGQDTLAGISESGLLGSSYNGRGAVNRNTLFQVRQEYEETISALNDEKRELVMKHSASVADVEKAEKRSWEREQENEKLKADLTSLKLTLQRAELTKGDTSSVDYGQSPNQASFYSAHEDEEDRKQGQGVTSPSRNRSSTGSYYRATMRSSPGIDRAKKEKAQHERTLRTTLSTFRNYSPSKPPAASPPNLPPTRRLSPGVFQLVAHHGKQDQNVLSPTHKHEQNKNTSEHSLTAYGTATPSGTTEARDEATTKRFSSSGVRRSSVWGEPSSPKQSGETPSSNNPQTIFDYIKRDGEAVQNGDDNGQSECKQS